MISIIIIDAQYLKCISILIYAYFDALLSVSDKKLEDVTNRHVMQRNGWEINVQYTNTNDPHHFQSCYGNTFYGYEHGDRSISATFAGSGKAILNYGNCYNPGGVVTVYLNNAKISSAPARTPRKLITFDYYTGDVLKFIDGHGVIKLNSLRLVPKL